jgi:hypothetical protein
MNISAHHPGWGVQINDFARNQHDRSLNNQKIPAILALFAWLFTGIVRVQAEFFAIYPAKADAVSTLHQQPELVCALLSTLFA